MNQTTKNTLLWTAGGLIAYNLITKVIGLKTMQFYPDKVVSIQWDGINPIFEVAFIAQNTSFQTATIHSMAGRVLANNYWIGSIYSFYPQTIAPNSQNRVIAYLRLSWMGVVQTIVSAFESGIYGAEFLIEGNANVDSFPVPIKTLFKVGQ